MSQGNKMNGKYVIYLFSLCTTLKETFTVKIKNNVMAFCPEYPN